MKYPPVHYHEYLKLDQILNAQVLKSDEFKQHAHEEMLFIVVHQTYELWFKQILFEINSVLEIFNNPKVEENQLGTIVNRLERVLSIQRLIAGQIDVLETMTPLDFLEFRDFLYPASGFQSYQWKLLETKLGLNESNRQNYYPGPFYQFLKPEQQESIKKALTEPSLFQSIESWLERTPFLADANFNFWQEYKQSVLTMLEDDKNIVQNNKRLSDSERTKTLEMLELGSISFKSLFDETKFKELQKEGHFRLSLKALQAALFIMIYRDQPALSLPFKLLSTLLDIDEKLTEWRHRHALMAHRMLGKKIGTGGSSGYDYLKTATEKHKIFNDLFNLTTFFVPRSRIPKLPKTLNDKLNFSF